MSTALNDSVSVSTTTKASPDLAFEVFTARIADWWNPTHHVLPGTLKTMGIEPFVGGRLWDENTDGQTCTWGRVLTWEPGRTFAFAWLIGPDWDVPADDATGSRVTVTFTAVEGGTRVDLVHDQLAAHGPGWEAVHAGVGSQGGWADGLLRFASASDAA